MSYLSNTDSTNTIITIAIFTVVVLSIILFMVTFPNSIIAMENKEAEQEMIKRADCQELQEYIVEQTREPSKLSGFYIKQAKTLFDYGCRQ